MQKSLDVAIFGGHHLLHVGLESGEELGDRVPVHVGHRIPDSCLESSIRFIGLLLQDAPH